MTAPGLFSALPAIDRAGTLTFTPAQGASGPTLIEVTATDDGGTGNSGTDTTIETFLIPISLTPRADIAASMIVSAENADPGDMLVYTLTVTNNGPENVVDVLVDNLLPVQLGGATWTCSADAGNSCGSANGAGGIMDNPDIQAGDSVTYTLTATVTGSEGEEIPVSAEALPPSEPVDTVSGNNVTAVLTFIGLFKDSFESEK